MALVSSTTATQIGIVVRDIEQSSRAWAEVFGVPVPSWRWTDAEKAHAQYRGAPTKARAKLAFMRFGSVDIELIEPDQEPSTWREALERGGESVHHIAFVIDGMREHVVRLEAAGFPLAQKGEYTGGRYAYIDTVKALATTLELLENDRK